MCVSTPKVAATKVEAPTQSLELDTTNNITASRESDIQRRRRAMSRLNTMSGGSMSDSSTGKMKLGL